MARHRRPTLAGSLETQLQQIRDVAARMRAVSDELMRDAARIASAIEANKARTDKEGGR